MNLKQRQWELDEFGLPKIPKFAECKRCGEEFIWYTGPHMICGTCRDKVRPKKGIVIQQRPRGCAWCGLPQHNNFAWSICCSASCARLHQLSKKKKRS